MSAPLVAALEVLLGVPILPDARPALAVLAPLLIGRYYVAFHPASPAAVLRNKDPQGLAEWRARRWELFDGLVPTLADVTLTTVVARAEWGRLSNGERSRTYVALLVTAAGAEVVLQSIDVPKPRGDALLFRDLRRAGFDTHLFPGPMAAS